MTARPWGRADWLSLAAAFAVGILIRAALLPTQGLRGDLDQFVGWVNHIATNGLTTLYQGTDAGPVTFGPVMAYIWGLLVAIQPAFASATDASDTGIRMLMKLPASLADLGLAGLITFALRAKPRWAVAGTAAVLLVPVTWYVSAWWGQYESIFVLSGLAAAIAATRGRNGLAAVLIAVSLSTKPQAIPFIVPFAAWFWATGGPRELMRTGLIGAATLVVVWLPFIPAGGPADYLANLSTYQGEVFNVLSVRAWNVWWLLQEAAAGGQFIRDDVAFAGPLTFRHVGFAISGVLSLIIALTVIRDPRPRTLILSVAASVLTFFVFMTQMHERYAYAALIFLVLLLAERRARWAWAALGVSMSLNLVAAIPPDPRIGALVPVAGVLGIAGSVASLVLLTVIWSESQRRGSDEVALG